MATIKPFICVRPNEEVAEKVAALPYDVYNRQEALIETKKEPLSFLNIDRPETQFDETVDTYDSRVYDKAKELLSAWIQNDIFLVEEQPCYYIYELTMGGRAQTGIVACASIDDYQNNIIKKHEKTREDKEKDRIQHVDTCSAQTGPIFLAYRQNPRIEEVVQEAKGEPPLYRFVSKDGIMHCVWKISDQQSRDVIYDGFGKTEDIYIADGHHRAASAVKVGLMRRQANPEYSGEEEFNYFLSVLFPDEQLQILPYNRVVKDLNGYSVEQFLLQLEKNFYVNERGEVPYSPVKKATFGMFLDSKWYELVAKEQLTKTEDPVESLDVAMLQTYLLQPILGIGDPRIDKRIDFIGGIRGLEELERRVNADMKVAFSLYPTSIEELFLVSDAGKLMPPKSTWFEPKVRSGLFIHQIEE